MSQVGRLGVIRCNSIMFYSKIKTELSKLLINKTFVDTMTSATKNVAKILSLSAIIVAKVVASLTRISHTNFENESRQTKSIKYASNSGRISGLVYKLSKEYFEEDIMQNLVTH
jgi:hypothetical protein